MLVTPLYLSTLVNLIVQRYHFDAISVCIVWNSNSEFTLHQSDYRNYAVITSIYRPPLIGDDDTHSGLNLTTFESILVDSIKHTHCESFIAFEEEILIFAKSFMKSVIHSKWRSIRNKFLFIYTKGRLNATTAFNHIFFKDLANILFLEIVTESVFDLKTTKFVGSRKERPEEQIFLDRYNGEIESFEFNQNLYPDKLRNLQGRELVVATFPYEPYSILKNSTVTNALDVGNGNKDPSKRYLYDGTDAQILFHLCWMYNCSVQVDSSEGADWGFVYENYTAYGALGLVFNRKADIAMMSMYMWPEVYAVLDLSVPTSTSGVRCLVPAPRRVTSWLLPFEPFRLTLWVGIYACLILETFGLLLTRKMSNEEVDEHTWISSIKFSCITTLKLFISQGTNYMVNSTSVRIILFSCYMIDIIITSVYSGGLASILTVPSLEEPADSVDRMIKQKLIWAGTDIGWIAALQSSQEKKILELLYLFRILNAKELMVRSSTERIGIVLERLQYGHFATPAYIDRATINRMKIMTEDIYGGHCVAFVPRAWALLDNFNKFCLTIQSSGLLKYWEWKVVATYLDEKMQKQIWASANIISDDSEPVKLGMQNFAGIILLWIGGIVLSIVTFSGEIMLYRWTCRFN